MNNHLALCECAMFYSVNGLSSVTVWMQVRVTGMTMRTLCAAIVRPVYWTRRGILVRLQGTGFRVR